MYPPKPTSEPSGAVRANEGVSGARRRPDHRGDHDHGNQSSQLLRHLQIKHTPVPLPTVAEDNTR
ncbi:hypothetical protein J6590_033753 [Homalodisca vitripennis]|nr:hypothetical protein J6590_033753 [Homalodisca vitripennis]